MGFFDALRRVLGMDLDLASRPPDSALSRAWGLDAPHNDYPATASAVPSPDADEATAYDRAQWVKRLKRVLDELPATEGEWADLMGDAKALSLSDAWIREREVEEFRLMVRRAVSDRNVTEQEHRKLDMARYLIGMTEEEAERILHDIAAEAEKFFGGSVEGA